MEISKHKTLHFIGIGGAGMSAIATVALEMGYSVTGSDLKESISTIRLKDLGAKIFFGNKPANLREADVVIVSTAIPDDNPEYAHAKQEKMVILRRAEMLDVLMRHFQRRISVAGTHGKTTTSSMVAKALMDNGKKPTYLVGADLRDLGGNAGLGTSDYFVAESDESDGSFLYLHPNVGIITNIETDHLDYYKDFDNIKFHFQKFMQGIRDRQGYLIINRDDPVLVELAKPFEEHVIYYGIHTKAEVMATKIVHTPEGSNFTLKINGRDKGEVYLQVYGQHNVSNCLSVIALGIKENISLEGIKKSLFGFSGAKRRFQWIGQENGIDVYDDYGHHPTEIYTTLDGAKRSFPERRVICIFQPHRYTRTRDLLESFPDAFQAADMTIITEVYSANEEKIAKISGRLIVDKVKAKFAAEARFIAKKSDIPKTLVPLLRPGDLVITMGAGDIHTVAKELVAQLKTAVPKSPVLPSPNAGPV